MTITSSRIVVIDSYLEKTILFKNNVLGILDHKTHIKGHELVHYCHVNVRKCVSLAHAAYAAYMLCILL